jgi:hypothetical protein
LFFELNEGQSVIFKITSHYRRLHFERSYRGGVMTSIKPIEYLDRPPAGWFALGVMKKHKGRWDWAALMVDVHPDELRHCLSDGSRTVHEAWVSVSSKHRNEDAAWDALQDMIATRH